MMLQRSRRPKTAERAREQAVAWAEAALLQRSRRPKTAESLAGASGECHVSAGFNGAAVRRRRRAVPGREQRDVIVALQRSRRPKTAESDRLPGRQRLGRRASTEPPSEDGGEQCPQERSASPL